MRWKLEALMQLFGFIPNIINGFPVLQISYIDTKLDKINLPVSFFFFFPGILYFVIHNMNVDGKEER